MIRMTLLSAALQEYPDLRVVLLIDDPPDPRYAAPYRLLRARARCPARSSTARRARHALHAGRRRGSRRGRSDQRHDAAPEELCELAEEYEYGARWLGELAERHEVVDHSDEFFKRPRARPAGRATSTLTATALRSAADATARRVPRERVEHLYRRLAWTFPPR